VRLTVEPPRQQIWVAVRDPKEKASISGSGASETRKNAELLLLLFASDYDWCGIRASKKAGTFSTEHRVRDVTGQSRVAAGASGRVATQAHDIAWRLRWARTSRAAGPAPGVCAAFFPTRLAEVGNGPETGQPRIAAFGSGAPLPSESLATEI